MPAEAGTVLTDPELIGLVIAKAPAPILLNSKSYSFIILQINLLLCLPKIIIILHQ